MFNMQQYNQYRSVAGAARLFLVSFLQQPYAAAVALLTETATKTKAELLMVTAMMTVLVLVLILVVAVLLLVVPALCSLRQLPVFPRPGGCRRAAAGTPR